MRPYDSGKFYVLLLFHIRGSVIPRGLVMAIPNALLALALWYLFQAIRDRRDQDDDVDVGQVWAGYNFIIGFLIAFRTQQAYARWWEACGALQVAKCELFNAFSSVCSFCTTKPELKNDVDIFQQTMVRLTSMLYAAAMHQLSTTNQLDFEILDVNGLERASLEFLKHSTERVEILAEWILRLVVLNINSGVIPIGPPIIAARTFSELARSVIAFYNLRKICEFQFPFACAQMISVMLLIHWTMAPFVVALIIDSWHWAAIVTFICTFSLWSVNYMASEMERPFGDEQNDLPMQEMMKYLNRVLIEIVHEKAQTPPKFDTRVCTSKTTGKYQYFKKPRTISSLKIWQGGPRQSKLTDFMGPKGRQVPADLSSFSTETPPESDVEDSTEEETSKAQAIVVMPPPPAPVVSAAPVAKEAAAPVAPPAASVVAHAPTPSEAAATVPSTPGAASPTVKTPTSAPARVAAAVEAGRTPQAKASPSPVPSMPAFIARRNLNLTVPDLKVVSAHPPLAKAKASVDSLDYSPPRVVNSSMPPVLAAAAAAAEQVGLERHYEEARERMQELQSALHLAEELRYLSGSPVRGAGLRPGGEAASAPASRTGSVEPKASAIAAALAAKLGPSQSRTKAASPSPGRGNQDLASIEVEMDEGASLVPRASGVDVGGLLREETKAQRRRPASRPAGRRGQE